MIHRAETREDARSALVDGWNDACADYPLPEVSARAFAERRDFRFGEVTRDMVAKARGLFADPDRIAALRGRLDKALGREPSAAPQTECAADKEPGPDRGTDTAI